jgi:hypothetical protein
MASKVTGLMGALLRAFRDEIRIERRNFTTPLYTPQTNVTRSHLINASRG